MASVLPSGETATAIEVPSLTVTLIKVFGARGGALCAACALPARDTHTIPNAAKQQIRNIAMRLILILTRPPLFTIQAKSCFGSTAEDMSVELNPFAPRHERLFILPGEWAR